MRHQKNAVANGSRVFRSPNLTLACTSQPKGGPEIFLSVQIEPSKGSAQRRKEKVMGRNSKPILWFSVAVVSALSVTALCGLPAAAQQAATQPQVLRNAVVNEPSHFDVSAPLAALVATASVQQGVRAMHAPMMPKLQQLTSAPLSLGAGAAIAVQPLVSNPLVSAPLISATKGLGFEGVGQVGGFYGTPAGNFCPSLSGGAVVPPDTNAAVGDTQVVQWVNLCYAVFDKSSGALIAGPFAGTNFWAGFGAPCETNNDGDIIIQWDKANHRWLAAQNVFNGPPFYTCVAVSQTADATGSYFRYTFPQPGFPDYPKWGLTRSVYYQTQNNFGDGTSFAGVTVCAYQAARMLQGKPNALQVCIVDNSNGTLFDDSMLPADDDTPGLAGPEVLLGAIDNFLPGDTHVYEFVFTVDFEDPANSTLAGVDGSMPISVPAFNLAFCSPSGVLTTYCVPQPDSRSAEVFFGGVWGLPPGGLVDALDTLGDRLMYRLARIADREGGTQHFLVTHNVNDTAAVAARWYEFRAPEGSTSLSLHQSGQTPDDGHYRWMGSIAMDRSGNIALGYSRSSGRRGDYPSIYYAGQTAGDTLGTTEREALIKQGSGSQYHSFSRWGDYSSMALDGGDSCTFWYTNEFYPVNGSFAWDTWVTSLKFPNCDSD
jgi:hypothetical protein